MIFHCPANSTLPVYNLLETSNILIHQELGWGEADYIVYMYSSSPYTIHAPSFRSAIIGESVTVLWRFRIHSDNIVSLLHGSYHLKLTLLSIIKLAQC